MDLRHKNRTNIISRGIVGGRSQAVGSVASLAVNNQFTGYLQNIPHSKKDFAK